MRNQGAVTNLNMVAKFKEAVEACNLMDIGYSEYQFSWLNMRYGPNFIEERLDRFLCNKDWRDKFQDSTITNLMNWVSNHYPNLMEVKERSKDISYMRKSFSRDYYEDMWSSYEDCKNIVKDE